MWLALDTATEQASIAVGFPGAIAAVESRRGARRHAAELLPAVQVAFARAGASLAEVEGIVIADGPGSFTGLRVGAAVAKALVRASGCALWSASSLMAMAAGVGAPPGSLVLAITDALRGELYAGAFRFFPGRAETELAPTVRAPQDLMASAPVPSVIVGLVASDVLGALGTWAGTPVVAAPTAFPAASVLLELIGLAGGAARVADPAGWEPEYGRPAEAQVRWEKAHGRRLSDPIIRSG